MSHAEFQLRVFSDARLAPHVTSALPAWLWSVDGARILWANPVGARVFGAASGSALAEKIFGPADARRRQVARLAHRLPATGAVRLERLRGFGAPFGGLVSCGCARLDFDDGSHGILIAAAESAGVRMPLVERLCGLTDGIDTPIAAFAPDGTLVGASAAARALLGFHDLSEAGLEQQRSEALKEGRAEASIGAGHLVLQRVGAGADVGLVALIAPRETQAEPVAPPADRPTPDYEQPANSGEAPAEFALIDEFSSPPVEAAAARGVLDETPEPDLQTVLQLDMPFAEAQPAEAPPSWLEEPSPNARRHPLRFTWQMDCEGRFSLGSEEFTNLIGTRTAAGFGRPWSEIAETFRLDPEGLVAKAIATRDSWSGITVNWPVDDGRRLPVELSGLPVYDGSRNFAGYRGFGVCRDLDRLVQLAASRRDPPAPQPRSSDIAHTGPAAELPAPRHIPPSSAPETPNPIAIETSSQTDLETAVETTERDSQPPPQETSNETPKNVLPFRPLGESKSPVLTPVENSAFNELARQLSARLDSEDGAAKTVPLAADAPDVVVEQPGWLAQPEPPARGEARRDKTLLDLLPVGVLIYRLDRLLYANPAFLERLGYPNLHALEDAGGLDALYVEPGVSNASSTSDTGTPVTISAGQTSREHAVPSATDARLYTISWDGDSALALIFSGAPAPITAAVTAMSATIPAAAPSPVGHANAEELGAILDTTADGIVMFDAEGNINSCNRSAEALFGYDGPELVQRNLAELFAPESQRVVRDYLDSTKGSGVASLLDHGRELLGRTSRGGIIPLSMTMGRTQPQGPNFFAVFRDLSQVRKSESELQQARRQADRAASAKADLLARISHEVRTPLNAIIGFAEVMIGERFGTLGNERYFEYMQDIRASGERVIAIINDLLDLSRIETGKLDLAFANQNLNDLVEQCVAVMQPQANRERIIIRTSLAQMLPPVVADARALRQIALNLIGNSIHLANAGGQVIVSTALSDFGDVVLRVRDTGHGLSENEIAAAMEPFRTQAPSDRASPGVSLSLTKALVEANRAQFHIKTGSHPGTLIEVVFSDAMAKA